MLSTATFDTSVFINCPFDKEFEPVLQAILFCVLRLSFHPRLATESNNSADTRLSKIIALIEQSQFSIHDLSRCQARRKGEHFRLNMPLELGIDYGCRRYRSAEHRKKKFLVLEEQQYRYQAAISDLSGCDIKSHGGNYERAMREVRNWLVSEAGAEKLAASRIHGDYQDFQAWYYEERLADGYSEDDIKNYPTSELLDAMKRWLRSKTTP
jgi:hypothetical protein